MRGLVIKSVILTILLVGGLFALKYFLKSSVNFIFNFPVQHESLNYYSTGEEADTNIVLVNISRQNRQQLAQTINTIAEGNPRVIALNVCFDRNFKTPSDSSLFNLFRKENNVVLINTADKCRLSKEALHGKEEFYIQEDGTVKTFFTDSAALSSVIVRLYDNRLYEKLKHRKKKEELINFIGNHTHFLTLDAGFVNYAYFPKEIFKDKIILLGYLGNLSDSSIPPKEEGYNTPLYGTKMSGTEITANILHTIIQEKYITVIPLTERFGIYMAILIFNSLMGFVAIRKSKRLFAFTLTILVIAESCLAAFLMINLFQQNIILNIEELPFVILGGFLIQYYLLKCRFYLSPKN